MQKASKKSGLTAISLIVYKRRGDTAYCEIISCQLDILRQNPKNGFVKVYICFYVGCIKTSVHPIERVDACYRSALRLRFADGGGRLIF